MIKRKINKDQVGFIPGWQGWFKIPKLIMMHTTLTKQKIKSYSHLNGCRKVFDKIQHSFRIKNSQQRKTSFLSTKVGTEETHSG